MGGSFENRVRLTREVIRRIRAACSPSFIVGVRLSPEPNFSDKAGWNVNPDETVELARNLCDDGSDFISVSLFKHAPTHVASTHKTRADAKPLVQVFREACPKDVIVMACGRISSAADVQALSALDVDVAVMGTAAISTPDFPMLLRNNPNYEVLTKPPFTKEFLASVDVSPPFVDMLVHMGMVQTSKL